MPLRRVVKRDRDTPLAVPQTMAAATADSSDPEAVEQAHAPQPGRRTQQAVVDCAVALTLSALGPIVPAAPAASADAFFASATAAPAAAASAAATAAPNHESKPRVAPVTSNWRLRAGTEPGAAVTTPPGSASAASESDGDDSGDDSDDDIGHGGSDLGGDVSGEASDSGDDDAGDDDDDDVLERVQHLRDLAGSGRLETRQAAGQRDGLAGTTTVATAADDDDNGGFIKFGGSSDDDDDAMPAVNTARGVAARGDDVDARAEADLNEALAAEAEAVDDAASLSSSITVESDDTDAKASKPPKKRGDADDDDDDAASAASDNDSVAQMERELEEHAAEQERKQAAHLPRQHIRGVAFERREAFGYACLTLLALPTTLTVRGPCAVWILAGVCSVQGYLLQPGSRTQHVVVGKNVGGVAVTPLKKDAGVRKRSGAGGRKDAADKASAEAVEGVFGPIEWTWVTRILADWRERMGSIPTTLLLIEPKEAALALKASKLRGGVAAQEQQLKRTLPRCFAPRMAPQLQPGLLSGVLPAIWKQPDASVMVVGTQGVGKSTLCRNVCNGFTSRYGACLWLELDLGQGECLPCGTLSLSIVTTPLLVAQDHTAHTILAAYHLGAPLLTDVFAASHALAALCADVHAVRRARPSLPLVINTHGWVHSVGRRATVEVLQRLRPQHIMHLQLPSDDDFISEMASVPPPFADGGDDDNEPAAIGGPASLADRASGLCAASVHAVAVPPSWGVSLAAADGSAPPARQRNRRGGQKRQQQRNKKAAAALAAGNDPNASSSALLPPLPAPCVVDGLDFALHRVAVAEATPKLKTALRRGMWCGYFTAPPAMVALPEDSDAVTAVLANAVQGTSCAARDDAEVPRVATRGSQQVRVPLSLVTVLETETHGTTSAAAAVDGRIVALAVASGATPGDLGTLSGLAPYVAKHSVPRVIGFARVVSVDAKMVATLHTPVAPAWLKAAGCNAFIVSHQAADAAIRRCAAGDGTAKASK